MTRSPIRGPRWRWPRRLLDLVGDTPLVRLDRTGRDLPCQLLAKLEYLNPGGSVKDRPPLAWSRRPSAEGLLGPGAPSSSRPRATPAIGLAIVAARAATSASSPCPTRSPRRNAHCCGPTAPKSSSALLRSPPTTPIRTTRWPTGLRGDPRGVPPEPVRQSRQPESPRADDRPRDLAADSRAHHPLRGRHWNRRDDQRVGRYLKAQNRTSRSSAPTQRARSTQAAAAGPTWSRGSVRTSGPDLRPHVVDRVVTVSDRDTFLTARRVTAKRGSSSAARPAPPSGPLSSSARPRPRRRHGRCSSLTQGRGYLSKVYNDGWMADHGFVRPGATVEAVLRRRPASPVLGPRPP